MTGEKGAQPGKHPTLAAKLLDEAAPRYTIKDVSRHLGVSPSTTSRRGRHRFRTLYRGRRT